MSTDDPQGTQQQTAPLVGNSHVQSHLLESATSEGAPREHPHDTALREFQACRGNQEALCAARGELGPVAQETVRTGPQSDEDFVPYNDHFGPFQRWMTDGTLEAMDQQATLSSPHDHAPDLGESATVGNFEGKLFGESPIEFRDVEGSTVAMGFQSFEDAHLAAKAQPGVSAIQMEPDGSFSLVETDADETTTYDLLDEHVDFDADTPVSALVTGNGGLSHVAHDGNLTTETAPATLDKWSSFHGPGLEGVDDANFETAFTNAMRDHMYLKLEAGKTGANDQVTDRTRAQSSASALLDVQSRIDGLKARQGGSSAPVGSYWKPEFTGEDAAQLKEAIAEKKRLQDAFPFAHELDRSALTQLADPSFSQEDQEALLSPVRDRVHGAIDRTKTVVQKDDFALFGNPTLVKETMEGLGILEDDPRYAQIMAKHAAKQNEELVKTLGPAALGVTLAATGVGAGLAGFGAAAGTLGTVGAGVGVVDAAANLSRMQGELDVGMVGVGDSEAKLGEHKDATWAHAMAALDLAGLGGDAVALAKAARLLGAGADATKLGSLVQDYDEVSDFYKLDEAAGVGGAHAGIAEGFTDAAAASGRQIGPVRQVKDGSVPTSRTRIRENGNIDIEHGADMDRLDHMVEMQRGTDILNEAYPDEITKLTGLNDGNFSQIQNPAKKLELHAAKATVTIGGNKEVIGRLEAALATADDIEEIEELEGYISRLNTANDELAQRLDPAALDGKTPEWLNETPYLENYEARYKKFEALPPAERKEAAKTLKKNLADPDHVVTDQELKDLGYTITDNGVVCRPRGFSGDLPPIRKTAGGGFVHSDKAGRMIDHGATVVAKGEVPSPLQRKQSLEGELKHGPVDEQGQPLRNADGKRMGRLYQMAATTEDAPPQTIGEILDMRKQVVDERAALGWTADQSKRRKALAAKANPTEAEQAELSDLNATKETWNKQGARLNAMSEVLGEEAAYKQMASDPNMQFLHAGQGPHTFDQVWMNKETGEIVFVEAKGGRAANTGTRQIRDSLKIAQQGSGRYFEDLWSKGNLADVLTQRAATLEDSTAAQKLMDSIEQIDTAVNDNLLLPVGDRQNLLPKQVDYRMYQQQLAESLDVLVRSEFTNAG